MNANVLEKLKILAESAKYDVSCASSGTVRANKPGMLGNTVGGWGICHSFAEDGRCISLLKIMLTNYCIYDCAYCINRRSNDLPRATLSVSELVDLTIEFYRRNYIEGLFLSSGVVRNPDYTMERLVRVAKDLREVHRFNGYIHLKSIPGASRELVTEAGRYADRLSVNVEIPKEENLKLLAPEKDHKSVFAPMLYIQQGILESSEERKKFRYAPRFAPAGQSTQMIVGATAETDKDILFLSSALYQRPTMKRVYYSGYVSVNTYDTRLPALKQPPLVRENRLYQADWLMRFYQFKVDEIVDDAYPDLDLEIDPKLSWALRHPEQFPIDINRADYEMILRVPGIGLKSAKLIIASRRYSKLGFYQLKKIGVVMKKKIQILGMKLDNYSVRESILLAESYLNGTSLNAIEDISMKMLMESENNEILGQALQELDMTIIGEKEILTAAEVETPQRLKETVEHEFFHEFMKRIARNHKIVYILGEKSEQIKALVGFLKEHYPRVTVSGVFALEDCPGDYESIINEVNGEAADVVISVIPSPQQEEFLMNYKSKMSAKVWYGIGEVTGLYSDTFLKKIFRKIFHKHVLLKRIEQYENEDEERK